MHIQWIEKGTDGIALRKGGPAMANRAQRPNRNPVTPEDSGGRRNSGDDVMDVLDQLGAVREGKLSRRAFTRSLLAAGVAFTTVPLTGRRAMAAPEDNPTYFTWGGYDIPELFVPYQEKYGELPNFTTYGATEDAFTKLRSGFVAEVTHPCMADVPIWNSTGLFQPIDTTRLSNWANIFPDLYSYDYNMIDGKPWMVPFSWGLTSIVYREDLVEWKDGESWDLMYDERYSQRLGSLASAGDVWWCAAIYAGVDFKDIGTPESFAKVAAVLRKQRPLIRMYSDDTATLDQALTSGEIVASVLWNSSALYLRAAGVPVRFAKPKEGALAYVCGLMLHKDAPKLDRAYDMIDSLISQPSGEFLLNDYGYGAVNKTSYEKFTDAELDERGLGRDPAAILASGHLGSPQTIEWGAATVSELEQIKAGF
jgi:spermidine/putrescine transport system substrate-binding protein